MYKKVMLSLAAALFICFCLTPFAMAQTANEAALLEAVFAKEPPLTQKDIDMFIKIGPDMVKAASANDVGAATAALQKASWTEARGSYVTAKISNAYAMSLSPDMAKSMLESAGMPSILLPTADELKLVQNNMDKLTEVFMSFGSF